MEVFTYVNSGNYDDHLAVQEDVLLRLAEVVERVGTRFAFPSTVTHNAVDTGVNAERGRAAEKAVAAWRANDRLPFPEFEEVERWEMLNTGEYPAPGSPGHRRAKERRLAESAANDTNGRETGAADDLRTAAAP